jgi:hypothetical protein
MPLVGPTTDEENEMEVHDIESITFEIVFKSGSAEKVAFIRPEKTLELLRDEGSLGDFLRGLVKRGTD